MKTYMKYIKPYWPYFLLAPLLMLIEVAGDVVLPSLFANIINIGAANQDVSYIVQTSGIMIGIVVVMIIGGVGAAYFATKASVYFSSDLRQDLFNKIQEFSFANIDTFSTGSLITRLLNDVTQLQNVVMMSLRLAFRAPAMLIGSLFMAFMMDAQLALILLIAMPVLVIGISFVLKAAMPRFTKLQKCLDNVNVTLQEALTNIRVIKSFVREDYEEKKFQEVNNNLKDSSLNAYKLVIVQMPLMALFMNACTLAVVWFGGQRIIAGRMEIGVLSAFTTYIVQVLMSLMMLANLLLQFSRASACAARIKEVLNTVPDVSDKDAKYPNKLVEHGDIEFRNVSFKYYKNSEEEVLKNINLKIDSGQTVGIIGSTGCGKTTLVSLISRLYDADSGEILVNGINVKDYSLYNLREGIGMVLQKNVLFSGTVEENLRWGNESATEEELLNAAQSAQALRFVQEMKYGMKTNIDQGGANVSGGQKQRLCIARALLKRPKILILDDSTSAVDTATEALIRKSFSNELKDTTKLIIAQRISSVQNADVIFVMNEGEIVDSGTHNELLAQSETYREIYESQTKKEV